MIASGLFRLLLVIVRVTVGKSSQIAVDEPLSSTAPQSFSYSVNRPNESSLALNTSSENMVQRCDPLYGMYPDIGDCQDALSQLHFGSEQRTFGERDTGLPDTVIALPFVVFGSMPFKLHDLTHQSSAIMVYAHPYYQLANATWVIEKGLCYIQPVNVGDGPTAHASPSQIRAAAERLILACVADADSSGGIAINIGGDDNLGVIIGTYEPEVQCMGTHVGWQSCLEILSGMPATTEIEIFGLEGQPGVQEVLPVDIITVDDRCHLKIFSNGEADSTSWYKIWQAAEATYAMCNKQGRSGWGRYLGEHGRLSFFLTTPIDISNNGSQALKLSNAPSSIVTGAL